MSIAGSQYIIDFVAEATAAPWSNASWTNIASTFQNTNGSGLRPSTAGVTANNKYNVVATASLIKAKCTFNTGAAAFSDTGAICIIDSSTSEGYLFNCNGNQGSIRKRTTGTGLGTALGSAFTITLTSSSEVEIWYNKSNGDLSAVIDDVVVATANDTQYQASSLVTGLHLDPQNSNSRRVGKFAADLLSSTVTINSTPANSRISESRTIRVTSPSTLNTGNTSVKINSAGNAAITPSSVVVVSGTTVDVTFTVPDGYAGLPYSATGYGIIVTTPDGSATSTNVPYLPVTGNDYVVLTSAPGDFDTSLGTLAAGDIIEYETNGGDISVGTDGFITSALANDSFLARAWDATDNTYGSWALITISDGSASSNNGLNLAIGIGIGF